MAPTGFHQNFPKALKDTPFSVSLTHRRSAWM